MAISIIAILNTGFLTKQFSGLDSLIQSSSDIIIARCVATPDPYNMATKDGTKIDLKGLINSDVEITSILKGATNSGLVRMTSEYWPRQGEYYLIFSNYRDEFYQALEKYRIVPLGPNCSTNSLIGKSLDEQLQILFKHRVDDLNLEIQSDEAEKQRLEEGLNK